jgi:hypothetical protein
MRQKQKRQAARKSSPTAKKTKSASSVSRGARQRNVTVASLPSRSQIARDRGLHVLAAMRRDASLTATRAAELEGISYRTLTKYFASELVKSGNRYQVTPSDRRVAYLSLPDDSGNLVLRKSTSSKERQQAGAYLSDFNRYLRGDRAALAKWAEMQRSEASDYSLTRARS